MRLTAVLLVALALAGCGGSKSATTLTVTCTDGTEVIGTASVDVSGDLVNGRPTMSFPDPANAGKTGTVSVQPSGHCKITPGTAGG
jgi:hypothetical protein